MPTYQFLVDDDRYDVPTLVLSEASTDGYARAQAQELLLQSPHHHAVEVYVGERYVLAIRRALGRASGSEAETVPRLV